MNPRETLHLVRATAPLAIARLEGESDSHYEKRCAAICALQDRWVRSPQYVFQPRHSTNPEVYQPARAQYLSRIAAAAAADRARNPAALRTVRLRAALGGT